VIIKINILVLFCLLFLASASAQDSTKKVEATIVTWNIQMLPNHLGLFSDYLRKKQRVRLPWITEHCNKSEYDVVVFQEVFHHKMKRKLKRQLKEKYPYIQSTTTKFGRWTSSGVVIASKHPLTYIDHVTYKAGVHIDKWAAKACVLVEIEKDSSKFRIAGTHLQSQGDPAAIIKRDKQYVEIKTLLDKNNDSNVPVFVAGDMNTGKRDSAKYNLMINTIGVEDFPLDEERPYTYDEQNTWINYKAGAQIDYIMLKKGSTSTAIKEQKVLRPRGTYKSEPMDYADHYGVVSKVVIDN